MENLSPEQLRHVATGQREGIARMFARGDFGAHSMAVARMLRSPRLSPKEWFALGEQYLPQQDDLPSVALAAYFHLISSLVHVSTAQRALACDAEDYCNSEPNSLSIDAHDLRQRFIWERSDELPEPFEE